MPKLPRTSGSDCISVLKRLGFAQVRPHGSHVVLRRGQQGCVVPRQAEVDADQFIKTWKANPLGAVRGGVPSLCSMADALGTPRLTDAIRRSNSYAKIHHHQEIHRWLTVQDCRHRLFHIAHRFRGSHGLLRSVRRAYGALESRFIDWYRWPYCFPFHRLIFGRTFYNVWVARLRS